MVDIKKILDEVGEECSPSFYIKQGIKVALEEMEKELSEVYMINIKKYVNTKKKEIYK